MIDTDILHLQKRVEALEKQTILRTKPWLDDIVHRLRAAEQKLKLLEKERQMNNGRSMSEILDTLSKSSIRVYISDMYGRERETVPGMRQRSPNFRVSFEYPETNIKVVVEDDELENAIRRAFDAVRN